MTSMSPAPLAELGTTVRPPGPVIVTMPAYNAEQTLEVTLKDIDRDVVDEIILVDDASTDGTVALAERLGLTTIRHETNRGYGAGQKTCYAEALRRGADIVVMVHPDYQYDSRVVPAMVQLLRLDILDVVLGSRIRSRKEAMAGGMPPWKYLSNRLLTFTENVVLGQNAGDMHTGLRAYTRDVLEAIPFERNSDDFVFDSQFLVQSVYFDFRIGDVPVPSRYFHEASSINFKRSVTYGLGTLGVLGRYALQKAGLGNSPLFERADKRDDQAASPAG
jgi:glycosyltransferase involved in cell wall biosynthesis